MDHMPENSYDILRRALLDALGPRPSADQRRQIAADLRALAEQQERMADRDTPAAPRAGDKLPQTSQVVGKASTRLAGYYVRIRPEQDPFTGVMRIRVSLGLPIWIALGSPERIEVQRTGSNIWIVPAVGAAGNQLTIGAGLPSCVMDSTGPLAQLVPGRYAATLQAGAIVIGTV